jgi:hypothetical protein
MSVLKNCAPVEIRVSSKVGQPLPRRQRCPFLPTSVFSALAIQWDSALKHANMNVVDATYALPWGIRSNKCESHEQCRGLQAFSWFGGSPHDSEGVKKIAFRINLIPRTLYDCRRDAPPGRLYATVAGETDFFTRSQFVTANIRGSRPKSAAGLGWLRG